MTAKYYPRLRKQVNFTECNSNSYRRFFELSLIFLLKSPLNQNARKRTVSNQSRPNDRQIIEFIGRFQADVQRWSEAAEIWFDCGFQSYAERIDGEPTDPPVVTILYFSQEFSLMLEEVLPGLEDFQSLLDRYQLYYEQDTSCTLHFYPKEESAPFALALKEFLSWQWICSLVQPDFSDVSAEIYDYFSAKPDDLFNLDWRSYEILLHRIFQARGFISELGPGSGDGGVDIRLLQRDPLGDMLTLVQAKKYNPKNKIGLEAVQALHGAADVEQAQKSLFITTSSYLSSAKSFAARTTGRLELCTSLDVVEWCRQAKEGIIQDKSTLVSQSYVSKLFDEVSKRPNKRVLRANSGVTIILNEFALVLKETDHAAILMTLPKLTTSDDGYGQVGFEVPKFDDSTLLNLKAESVWRVKRRSQNGHVTYWDGQHLYSPWSGNPEYFNWLD
jgi:hypothetical protein